MQVSPDGKRYEPVALGAKRVKKKRGCLFRGAQFLLVLALVIGGYGWWWASRKPTIKRNYTAELNAPILAADPATLAWPEIRAALIAMPSAPESLERMDGESVKNWWDVRPGEPKWAEVVAHLETIRPTLTRVRSASAKPSLGYVLTDGDDPELAGQRASASSSTPPKPASENPALLDVQLAHLGKFRFCARMLRADARAAITENDPARAIENIRALFDLARLLRDNPIIISTLVSVAIETLGCEVIAECAETSPKFFTAAQLEQLDTLLRTSAGKQDLNAALGFERMNFEDHLQRTFSDDGAGNGALTWKGIGIISNLARTGDEPMITRVPEIAAGVLIVADRKSQLEMFDRVLASHNADASVQPWQYRGASRTTSQLEDPRTLLDKMRYAPVHIFFPALSKVYTTRWQHESNIAATRVVIALHRHHHVHGGWPDSLDQLVPSFLDSVPLDRFDGKPLRFAIRTERPLVYSVGSNRTDDGGAPAPHGVFGGEWVSGYRLKTERQFQPGQPGWDHIYFPPSAANLPAKQP